jgi:hypothetical protein
MASIILEVAVLARDSVEGLQDVTVENPLRVLLGLV